ncbi:MAG: hypothetical protein IPH24_03105 [Crocinitomicaceae bacterium]|nr:hypothetical protein [Crocinitomicaceae bacterium]
MFVSCNKEKLETAQTAPNLPAFVDVPEQKLTPVETEKISIENGVLVFESIEFYESIVNFEDYSKVAFTVNYLNSLDFNSFGKANPKSELFDDEFMDAIMNADQVVKIGAWFIRINPETETVSALNDLNISEYSSLISEDFSNTTIVNFSTSDDVLEMLKNNDLISTKLGCGESGINGYDEYFSDEFIYSTSWLFDGALHFNRFGIYYHLFAEAASNVSGVFKIYINLEPVYYHVKCGITNGPYNVYNYQHASAYASYQKYSSYQGSTNLNEVYFRGRIQAVYTHTNGVVYSKYTPWKQIRVNY